MGSKEWEEAGSRAGTRVGQARWAKLAVDSRTHLTTGQEPGAVPELAKDRGMAR